METWAPIEDANGYEVSDLGRVRSIDRVVARRGRWGVRDVRHKGRILKSQTMDWGHQIVALGAGRMRLIHRLVLTAFVGACPEGMVACHNDGDAANNTLANLRWDTQAGNLADRYDHGTLGRKLTPDAVRTMFQRRSEGATHKVLAVEFGVAMSMVSLVLSRKAWSQVDLTGVN